MRVSQQPLQPGVFVFKPLQPLGLRDVPTPYLAFHLYMLASLKPCLRHSSATAIQASCSFKIAMIRSSLKRVHFILWSSIWARANFKLDKLHGARS